MIPRLKHPEAKYIKMKPVHKARAALIKKQLSADNYFVISGKYNAARFEWRGSVKDYQHDEIDVLFNVKAIWIERCQDNNGPYAVLCFIGIDECHYE